MLALNRRSQPARQDDEAPAPQSVPVAIFSGLLSLALTILVVLAIVAGTMLLAFGPAAPLVTVPEVVGKPSKNAKERLEAKRLKMSVVNYEYNPNVKEGSVIAISPYAGKLVRAGREVRAVVSRGSRNVKVPAVKGLLVEEAVSKLTNLDLQVGDTERKSSDKPPDTVMGQTPPAGTVLNRKGKVDLLVSGGKDFSVVELADGKRFIFRRLKIIVPQGKALQMVTVDVQAAGDEKSFLERLCRPGEIVDVNLYGREGARVRVKIEDDRVFSERL